MQIYKEIIKMNIKVFFQHRMAFFMTLIMQIALILIYLSLFYSIYTYNDVDIIKGYNLSQMVWYFAAANFVTACVLNFADRRISNRIISGQLSVDLLRPLSLYTVEISNAIALRIIGFFIEFLLALMIIGVIYFPTFITVMSFLRFLLLIIGSFMISFLISYFIGLSAFYIKSNNSLIRLKTFFISFAGGAFIPLEFFPDWFNQIMDVLPFKFIYYWPIQFFLNREQTRGFNNLLKVLINQWFWVLLLGYIGHVFWKKVIKEYCAVGG